MDKIDIFRAYLFLGRINGLKVSYVDVGHGYIHNFAKYNIYTVSGNDFC